MRQIITHTGKDAKAQFIAEVELAKTLFNFTDKIVADGWEIVTGKDDIDGTYTYGINIDSESFEGFTDYSYDTCREEYKEVA